MSELIGRKVKMLPHCLFYDGEDGNNTGMIASVASKDNADFCFVNVVDSLGIVYPCHPHELRYLNGREVVV